MQKLDNCTLGNTLCNNVLKNMQYFILKNYNTVINI